jgi:hypothetical protein
MSSLFIIICFFSILSFQLHRAANKEIGRNLKKNFSKQVRTFSSLLHIIWGDSPFKKENFWNDNVDFFLQISLSLQPHKAYLVGAIFGHYFAAAKFAKLILFRVRRGASCLLIINISWLATEALVLCLYKGLLSYYLFHKSVSLK